MWTDKELMSIKNKEIAWLDETMAMLHVDKWGKNMTSF